MALTVITEREQAHAYLDRLPEVQMSPVRVLLESMLDPVSLAHARAPWEDEEITADEEEAAARSREWLETNPGIPLEVILAEFGLTMADFERMGNGVPVAPPPPQNSSGPES